MIVELNSSAGVDLGLRFSARQSRRKVLIAMAVSVEEGIQVMC